MLNWLEPRSRWRRGGLIVVAVAGLSGFGIVLQAERVTTAQGAGADVELREQNKNGANSTAMNTRTSSGADRNEIIGLRFDLTGYELNSLSNVSLKLIAFRSDTGTRVVDLYGVTQGTVASEGSFTTENWSETGMVTFGSMPGLLATDGDLLTQSINSNQVTFLGRLTVPGNSVPAGGTNSFTNPTLTAFVQNYSGSQRITFLLAAGNNSTGQFRVASREANALDPASGITGEILHVDAGYNIMGTPGRMLNLLADAQKNAPQ